MKNKRVRFSSLVSLALIAVAAFFSFRCGKAAPASFEGPYASVSESGENVTLTLKSGGVAEIVLSTWPVGEYEKRETEKTIGRWSAKGNIVTVSYNGVTETFVYEAKLALAELGFKGGAPGLKQIRATDEKAIIGYYSLWKLPHTFGK